MCTAGFSTEECFGPGGPLSGELTGNGNGGMYCDQALVPFITTAAECSTYSSLVWHGVPSGIAQSILPAVVAAGGVSVVTGGSISLGSIISGVGAILGGIGIGEWIYQRSRDLPIGRPKDGLPTGTKPLDQSDVPREAHGKVKKGAGIGPADWSGVDEDGNLWSGSPSGEAVNHGPWRDYIP
jgi:hypothetical protein